MRDWARSLRAASFRGVSFWVLSDDLSGGKRLALHEYAGGRVTLIEEMGLSTSSIDVTGYLIGDDSDSRSRAFVSACLSAGPGRLTLPLDGGMMAYVENFRRMRDKDRAGYIAFDFRAVPVSNTAGASLSAGDVISVFVSGLPLAVPGFGGIF
ncbi:prophage DNA circulation protein [Neorhizobium galegae]|uniref:DNA circularization N-terminal domain-containing protein n=1 Tax=Neorhizobium galegae TaxID=399 RepID=UPI001AEAC5BA|nr:DNA circularization N-terminal domain-containing protein [Neorhizobium galegae]MBP2560852.1 prophage DNA circulation protein [Neorhizobium galegae]